MQPAVDSDTEPDSPLAADSAPNGGEELHAANWTRTLIPDALILDLCQVPLQVLQIPLQGLSPPSGAPSTAQSVMKTD